MLINQLFGFEVSCASVPEAQTEDSSGKNVHIAKSHCRVVDLICTNAHAELLVDLADLTIVDSGYN